MDRMPLGLDELVEQWTVLDDERELVAGKRGATRLGFALLLKFFTQSGRFPAGRSELPDEAVEFVARQVQVPAADLGLYERSGRTVEYHRAQIREHLGFRECSVADADKLTDWLAVNVAHAERNPDRVREELVSRCRAESIEPPAPARVTRIVRSALHNAEETWFAVIAARLSPDAASRIIALVDGAAVSDDDGAGEDQDSVLALIKSVPGSVSLESMLAEIRKLTAIRAVGLPPSLFADVAPKVVSGWRARAAVESPSHLRRRLPASPQSTLTLLAGLLSEREREVTDSLVDLLIATVHRIGARAERKVTAELISEFRKVAGKESILFAIAEASLARPSDTCCPACPTGTRMRPVVRGSGGPDAEVSVRVRQQRGEEGSHRVDLLDEGGEPVEVVSGFLRFLAARDCSPNTLVSYAYDLRHLWRFFDRDGLSWQEFAPRHSIGLLEYLRLVPSRRPRQRMTLTVVVDADGPATKLAATAVNRILAAVSSFYEYVILAGMFERLNPIEKRPDPALRRVSERHRPFMGGASRQRPIRRAVRVKTVQRVPRPLSEAQVQALLAQLRSRRDRAIVLLMLQGGLRPGEVLGLHLEDIAYGRRRVVVRHRDDHPKGARSKSRYERVVDLHEPETLAMVSAYVMDERPADGDSPLVFLIGGRGKRRLEALSYDGLVKMFTRATTRAGIRTPWVTPHACRHTHATAMWEGGMRELTLQERLGHASPESTRIYTRVSDPAVVAGYNRALGSQDTNDDEQF